MDRLAYISWYSGDDHDYCDTSASGVRDITVKYIHFVFTFV
jgi:hypothetical protein